MRNIFSLLLTGVALLGCSDIHLPTHASLNLDLLPPNELCERAKDRGLLGIDTDVQAAAFDRGLIRYGDWERVSAGRIRKGMSDCAVVAILGEPQKSAVEPFVVGRKENRLWFYDKRNAKRLLYVLDTKWGQVEVCRRAVPGSDQKFTSC
jgi:hypothetical protein